MLHRTGRYSSERVDLEAYRSDPNDHLVACMHVATYDFARPMVEGRDVLDFGCGTGYGARHLADSVREILGVDVSPVAIKRAQTSQAHPKVIFRRIAPIEEQPLPFPDDRFDTVLSFQVIEHVPDVDRYLSEIHRVLRPGGTFVCATPDRRVRLFPGQRPWNVHHLTEYTPSEMHDLLQSTFEETTLYGMVSQPRDLMDLELRRFDKVRRISRPFTFARAPEWWRQAGLRGMKAAKRLTSGRRSGSDAPDHGYGPDAIRIVPQSDPSPNIVAVSR